MCMHICIDVYVHIHVYIYIWQRPKNIGLVTGGLFATRLVTESGGFATNPPCDKPIQECSALHKSPQQGFVTEGGRDKPLCRATAIYIYIHIYIHTCRYMCTYIHIYINMSTYVKR